MGPYIGLELGEITASMGLRIKEIRVNKKNRSINPGTIREFAKSCGIFAFRQEMI